MYLAQPAMYFSHKTSNVLGCFAQWLFEIKGVIEDDLHFETWHFSL